MVYSRVEVHVADWVAISTDLLAAFLPGSRLPFFFLSSSALRSWEQIERWDRDQRALMDVCFEDGGTGRGFK